MRRLAATVATEGILPRPETPRPFVQAPALERPIVGQVVNPTEKFVRHETSRKWR